MPPRESSREDERGESTRSEDKRSSKSSEGKHSSERGESTRYENDGRSTGAVGLFEVGAMPVPGVRSAASVA